jgi:hypothetical protein
MDYPIPSETQNMIGQTSSIVSTVGGIMSSAGGIGGGAGGAGGGGDSADLYNILTCGVGSQCYKTKQSQLLKKTFDDNKKNYDSVPLELSKAEKNYFVYNVGEYGGEEIYNKLIIDRFARTAEQFKKNSIDRQQQFMSDLLQSIKQYQAALVFKNQMANLLKLRQGEHDDLMKNINYYQKILQTSERKVVYENKNMDSLDIYRRIMIFLYYAGLVSFIIFGNFIPDKLYTKWTVWLIIVIIAIIPIIMNMLLVWIFIIYDTVSYWFSELPHKDVYINIGRPADEPAPAPPKGGN